ncbi:unnamed protein product [Trichogramma brassicae]|uniref:Uncharacterized protein n=1 Tax=Trichogramma brassicae TaxID=86971 RepID=A0A6H5IUI9_9HYME|nr:unnamed protein product [Trichogramma brassicae]
MPIKPRAEKPLFFTKIIFLDRATQHNVDVPAQSSSASAHGSPREIESEFRFLMVVSDFAACLITQVFILLTKSFALFAGCIRSISSSSSSSSSFAVSTYTRGPCEFSRGSSTAHTYIHTTHIPS